MKAPRISAICWDRGVAPRMYPVLRSWAVLPATQMAQQVTQPIVMAAMR